MNPPKLEHYVNDASKVLSESVRHEVNERLKNHDTQTTVQAVVYLFPHRQGRELLDIGLEIFDENGIGQKDTNNGLLLIVATEEKKLRIITGKGMEFEWNTEKCQLIVEQILRPLLNAGEYDEMVKAWCDCVEGKNASVVDMNKGIQKKISNYFETNSERIIIRDIPILLVFLGLCFQIEFITLLGVGMISLYVLASWYVGVSDLERQAFVFKVIALAIIIYLPSLFISNTLVTYLFSYGLNFDLAVYIFLLGGLLATIFIHWLFYYTKDGRSYSHQNSLLNGFHYIMIATGVFIGLFFSIWSFIDYQRSCQETACSKGMYETYKYYVEQNKKHPDLFYGLNGGSSNSSSSDSLWSSSDSDFGGGGGSSNGGGYGD